jgi:hypothetical protein
MVSMMIVPCQAFFIRNVKFFLKKFCIEHLKVDSGVTRSLFFEQPDPLGGISTQNPAMRKLKIAAIYVRFAAA